MTAPRTQGTIDIDDLPCSTKPKVTQRPLCSFMVAWQITPRGQSSSRGSRRTVGWWRLRARRRAILLTDPAR